MTSQTTSHTTGHTTADAAEPVPELLRVIEPSRCLELLNAVRYGRLAAIDAGEPLLVVLNHLADAGGVYVRTGAESRLARLTEGGRALRAVFEADSAFTLGESGWSVMAKGLLTREHSDERAEALRSRLVAWAQGDRDVVLHLDVEELTGRSVGAA